jgi:hypothetical protein
MTIFNLFSKRQADAAKSGQIDVYRYDEIPLNLRVQVRQIALEGMGLTGSRGDGFHRGDVENAWWEQIERVYLREKGLEDIADERFAGEGWLDLLELIAIGIRGIGTENNPHFRHQWQVSASAEDVITEINYRLRQAGVGYQIEGGQIIRVDSQFVHAEVVKPALALLSGPGFEGPRQEFLSAHQHFRTGKHREAVAMAANALESTFKAIFDHKRWDYNKAARISDLVKVARARGLWPDYLDASFDQLVATLQSGLPKIRDNDASHGQGATPKDVPAYIAAYALHLAASKIVFIAEAAKNL